MPTSFPKDFLWGTATSAAQIETAVDHQFKGLKAVDGFVLERTIDHERHRQSDAALICQLGNAYRTSVDWSRLQPSPLAPFDTAVVEEYREFFQRLRDEGMQLFLALHHFAHPRWFEAAGAWQSEQNIGYFVDFARRCREHFHPYVSHWITFNEPNAYVSMAYLLGHFPPFRKRSLRQANRALRHMGTAHEVIYRLFRETAPAHPIGIAHNVAWFEAKHPLGRLPAAMVHWWFNYRAARPFRRCDFWGINYYAYVPFTPFPITEITHPGRLAQLGMAHDQMWGYRPEGLGRFLRSFHRRYRRPVIVAEIGACTDDADRRIEVIRDYVAVCRQCLEEGVDLRGFFTWSTFDNFEWHLGPSYRFGLVRVNLYTKERQMTRAGEFFRELARKNGNL